MRSIQTTNRRSKMKIIYEKDNDCVGCPQGCVNCGRGSYKNPIAIECEKCGEKCDEIYRTSDGDYCQDCLTEVFKKVTVEDIADDPNNYEYEEWEEVWS